MKRLEPRVSKLVLSASEHKHKWKFMHPLRQEFDHHLPDRIWWVNANTKTKTYVHEHTNTTCEGIPPGPGLKVSAPLVSPFAMDKVIDEINQLYDEEHKSSTFPQYNHDPYNNMTMLFIDKNRKQKEMTYSDVLAISQPTDPLNRCSLCLINTHEHMDMFPAIEHEV